MSAPELPPLDFVYECQRDYGLTQPTGADYSIIESNARAQCRERQLAESLAENAKLRAEIAKDKWISVDERLPTKWEEYLVYRE